MKTFLASFLGLLVLLQVVGIGADRIERSTVFSNGKNRLYHLFVPGRVKADTPAPLIVMLHGAGSSGVEVRHWRDVASKEGIILAGPNATNPSDWSIPDDGPEFLRDLVESLKSKYPVDHRRVYLFGQSLGGVFALRMSLLESEYFAAVAVHASALSKEDETFVRAAKRKIPVRIVIGTADEYYSLSVIRGTRDLLLTHGIPAEVTEIRGHTHYGYKDRTADINPGLWDFFRKHELPSDPRYTRYTFTRQR
jgi:poly(3-hydroxybutyrate) depolymerase